MQCWRNAAALKGLSSVLHLHCLDTPLPLDYLWMSDVYTFFHKCETKKKYMPTWARGCFCRRKKEKSCPLGQTNSGGKRVKTSVTSHVDKKMITFNINLSFLFYSGIIVDCFFGVKLRSTDLFSVSLRKEETEISALQRKSSAEPDYLGWILLSENSPQEIHSILNTSSNVFSCFLCALCLHFCP